MTDFMKLAVELAGRCPPTARAFSVGAVLTGARGEVLATGYSRERGPAWHAEEVALAKAREAGRDPRGGVIYSTMEPCGRRLSGRVCCADLIAAAGVAAVHYCIAEPPVFVTPTGLSKLALAGLPVHHDARFTPEVTRQNEIPPAP